MIEVRSSDDVTKVPEHRTVNTFQTPREGQNLLGEGVVTTTSRVPNYRVILLFSVSVLLPGPDG